MMTAIITSLKIVRIVGYLCISFVMIMTAIVKNLTHGIINFIKT